MIFDILDELCLRNIFDFLPIAEHAQFGIILSLKHNRRVRDEIGAYLPSCEKMLTTYMSHRGPEACAVFRKSFTNCHNPRSFDAYVFSLLSPDRYDDYAVFIRSFSRAELKMIEGNDAWNKVVSMRLRVELL